MFKTISSAALPAIFLLSAAIGGSELANIRPKLEVSVAAPNTDCGKSRTSQIVAGAALSGTGATKTAAFIASLLAASGTVCKICDDGLQCERSIDLAGTSGTATGTYQHNADGTWTFTGTVNPAGYTVKADCAAC